MTMFDRRPLIQVHIPVRNEEKKLPAFLDSIANQTFTNCEYIFHNNNSSDSSLQVLDYFSKNYNRTNIRVLNYLHTLDACDYEFRFRFFNHTAPYVSLRSANDVLHPDYYSAIVDLLKEHHNVALAYSHGYLVYEDDLHKGYRSQSHLIDTEGLSREQSLLCCVKRYTVSFSFWGTYKREVFEKTNSFRIACYGNDHVLVSECSLHGAIKSTEHPLEYRIVSRSEPGEINHAWLGKHLLYNKGVRENSSLIGADFYLPYHSMLSGYFSMLRMSGLEPLEVQSLSNALFGAYTRRFENQLESEAEIYLNSVLANRAVENSLALDAYPWNIYARTDMASSLKLIRYTCPALGDQVLRVASELSL